MTSSTKFLNENNPLDAFGILQNIFYNEFVCGSVYSASIFLLIVNNEIFNEFGKGLYARL